MNDFSCCLVSGSSLIPASFSIGETAHVYYDISGSNNEGGKVSRELVIFVDVKCERLEISSRNENQLYTVCREL